MKYLPSCLLLVVTLFASARAEETFRTDATDNKELPWYQIQPGTFPPEGSAHYYSGELIRVDHLNRRFVLRVDRTDAQNRSHWDLPMAIGMLPFGAIYYHGAPAALEDIPLGTHMHGQFYEKDPNAKEEPLEGWHNRVSYEKNFTRCFLLEDDFSHHARLNQAWRIDDVNLEEMKLTATLLENEKPQGEPKQFDLLASTRVWQGEQVVSIEALQKDQVVQFNITWATLYGPGRVREIWTDEASRAVATAHQLEVHRLHVRERGLAGWIDEVDNQERMVTITLFGGVDPELLTVVKEGISAGLVVAEDSLQTYDPVNDRKSGPIREVKQVSTAQGSSGIQIRVQPDLLLEGFRPKRIVRVYPNGWPVIALPSEEQLFGR